MQNLSQYYSATLPDTPSLQQLVSGERPGFAVDGYARILNESFTPLILTTPPNPNDSSDVSSWVLAASLDRNTTSDVVTSMNLILDSKLGDQINTLRVYIQFYTRYWDQTTLDSLGNPTLILSVPIAIVGFQIPDRSLDDAGSTLTVTGYEPTWRIRDLYFQNPFVIPAGMKVTSVIAALLQMDGLTKSEGGRSPSGIVQSTGPQSQFPATPNYCAVGVTAISVCTVTNSDGSKADPNGLLNYNPDGGILVDATSHIPIDPWTCHPMTLYPAIADTCVTSNGLYFNTRQAAFYRYLSDTVPLDPFTMAPLPVSRQYYEPNPNAPATTIGNTTCPLLTWPYDYTGAGPYYGTNGTALTSSGGGSTNSNGTGAATYVVGTPVNWGQRGGTGTVTVVPIATYNTQPQVCQADPNLPGQNWCEPVVGSPFKLQGPAVNNYSWPIGNWSVTITLRGGPLPVGSAAISAKIYAYDQTSHVSTLLGTLPTGTVVSFAAGVSSINLSCTASLQNALASATSTIIAYVTVSISAALTAQPGTGQATFGLSAATINAPTPTVVTVITTPPTTSGGNGLATPTSSGTVVPWPDTNNPGMCPNGCETPGPNIPTARLNITDSPLLVPAALPYDRKTNILAAIISLCKSINYNNPWSEEAAAVLQVAPKPLFSQLIPTAQWSFTTDAFRVIKPPFTQKLADQTGLKNKVIVISANNANDPIIAMGVNTSPSSEISIPNLGREVMGAPVQDDTIPNAATAALRVTQELQASASAMEAIQFTAAFVPFLQPYDAINVTIKALDGTILVDGSTYPYFLTDISVDLMDITSAVYTAARVVAV